MMMMIANSFLSNIGFTGFSNYWTLRVLVRAHVRAHVR